jgi:hypothetical protein
MEAAKMVPFVQVIPMVACTVSVLPGDPLRAEGCTSATLHVDAMFALMLIFADATVCACAVEDAPKAIATVKNNDFEIFAMAPAPFVTPQIGS